MLLPKTKEGALSMYFVRNFTHVHIFNRRSPLVLSFLGI